MIVFLSLFFSCSTIEAQDFVKRLSIGDYSYPREEVSILFTGDLMLHGPQIKAAKTQNSYNFLECFEDVKEDISKANIAIGNLEVTLGGKPYTGYPQFSSPDQFAVDLKEIGFDVLLTANNHCLDRRKKGLERTIKILDSLSIKRTGTFIDKADRHKNHPLFLVKGNIKIAILNYTYGTNGIRRQEPNIVNYIDKKIIKQDITTAKLNHADIIIACIHWGIEYKSQPNNTQKKLTNWMIDNGVDHIIGSHPHVIQPFEVIPDCQKYKKHFVVYSLGNFISNMSRPRTDGGLMIQLNFSKYEGITKLDNFDYWLTWCGRPATTNKKNYKIYKINNLNKELNQSSINKLNFFKKHATQLLKIKDSSKK